MASALVYDCFSGLSGDMNLGALVDLGVPAEQLRDRLAALPLASEFSLTFERQVKQGIAGTRAHVTLHDEHITAHRTLADIDAIIRAAELGERTESVALDIFRALAQAEATVHGISVETVHFHEVGATDAIVDIVGAAICREAIGAETVLCGPVELGGGTVRCAHGLMPVPAPATAELLRDVPCRYGGAAGEATTPTGAAILKTSVDQFALPAGFVPRRIGYGIGAKDFEMPNVARVMLGEVPDAANAGGEGRPNYELERNIELACNVDDMSPEAFEPLIERLFAAGAKDVFLTPVIMKKSRPATRISVLIEPAAIEAVSAALFAGSTTLGIRIHQVDKRMLPREMRVVPTRFGEVRVKVAQLGDGTQRWKPEHSDVVTLAARHDMAYLALKREIDAAIAAQLGA